MSFAIGQECNVSVMLRSAVPIAFLLLSGPAAAQAQTGVVSGYVVADGRPAFASVRVQGHRSLGAITDSSGGFRINGIPAGPQIVIAESIGFDPDVAFVTLVGGDSAEVRLEISEKVAPISGSDSELPSPFLQRTAAEALPLLLEDSLAAALLWQATSTYQPVLVWAPWAGVDSIFAVNGRTVHVISTCDFCVSSTSVTIEGGRMYTAGTPHLLLGLMARGARHQLLTLCAVSVQAQDTVYQNCASARDRLTYARRPDGVWVRLAR